MESASSSVAATSTIGLVTTGGSLVSVTVTVNTSVAVCPLEVAVTVTFASPFWSGRKCRVSSLPVTLAVTSPRLSEVAVFTMDALSSSTSLNTLPRATTWSGASSLTDTSSIGLAGPGASSTGLTVTTKVSLASWALDVPTTMMVAVPCWSPW